MNNFTRFIRVLTGFFPKALPVGMTAFDKWADDFVETYKITDIMSARDAKYTLATSIISAGGATAYKADFTFYLILRSAAAKQIAGAKFQGIQAELRAEQQARMEAEKAEAEKNAATTPPVTLVNPQN